MPELDWNASLWGGKYDWRGGGEEWSVGWGGSEAQWFGSLLPRLHRILPSNAILEIAPGYGRWTQYLLPFCSSYVGIDLSLACIDACKVRFGTAGHASFVNNDGFSLSSAPDHSFDFVFSFDSLVHAEFDVFEKYIPQILLKLTPEGVAFIHHSNLDGCIDIGSNQDSRAISVSACNVAELISSHGGHVILQEIINWNAAGLTDCLTTFCLKSHATERGRSTVNLTNPSFTQEASLISQYQSPYSRILRQG